MKNFQSIIFLMIIISLSSCSYEKMNSANQKRFHIQEFKINGDTRESFLIKKKIQRFSNEESPNKIKIFIDLKKEKSIKEKNVQNKVTKYNLSLSADVKIVELNTTKEIKRFFSVNQIYNVEDSYSNTVYNSKEANISLIDKIVDEILDQLKINYS